MFTQDALQSLEAAAVASGATVGDLDGLSASDRAVAIVEAWDGTRRQSLPYTKRILSALESIGGIVTVGAFNNRVLTALNGIASAPPGGGGWELRHNTGEITGSSGALGDLGTTTINGLTVTQRGTGVNWETTANGLIWTRVASAECRLTWEIADIIDDHTESQVLAIACRAEVFNHPNVNSFMWTAGVFDNTNEMLGCGPYSRGANVFDYTARRVGSGGAFETERFALQTGAPPAYVTWVAFLNHGGAFSRYQAGAGSIAIPAAADLDAFGTRATAIGSKIDHAYTQWGLHAYMPAAGEIRVHEISVFTR